MKRICSLTHLLADALGSPVAVTNQARTVLERREYEPYGRQLLPTALADGPGFTGHVSDAATGLSYMQQRYFDPGIGRFLSVDPVTANPSSGANFNRYWYANNNPYMFTDPDGRSVCTAGGNCAKINAAIAAIGEAAANLPADSYERQIVQSARDFYGAPDEDNGVTIGNETDPSRGGGTSTVDGQTTITIDVAAFGETPDLAAALGHEGDHGAEQQTFGMPQNETQEMASETRAATTEALVYKGLNVDSPRGAWTESGGLNSEAIQKEAAQSTTLWCQGNSACN